MVRSICAGSIEYRSYPGNMSQIMQGRRHTAPTRQHEVGHKYQGYISTEISTVYHVVAMVYLIYMTCLIYLIHLYLSDPSDISDTSDISDPSDPSDVSDILRI